MDRIKGRPLELLLQLVRENDLLRTNRFALSGLGWLARAALGDGPVLDGLACTPGEGLTVEVAPGALYQTAATDPTTYEDLPPDLRPVLKQGLMLDSAVLACPAPATPGQSIAYLVQASFAEADVERPDGGGGAAETVIRADQCLVSIKAGVAAATGSEKPPEPDAGAIGTWVVTVASDAVGVEPGDIALYAGAPFVTVKLPWAAPINSPVFTGDPRGPTPPPGDAGPSLATTGWAAAKQAAYLHSRLAAAPAQDDELLIHDVSTAGDRKTTVSAIAAQAAASDDLASEIFFMGMM